MLAELKAAKVVFDSTKILILKQFTTLEEI